MLFVPSYYTTIVAPIALGGRLKLPKGGTSVRIKQVQLEQVSCIFQINTYLGSYLSNF
jgi:hypothetical protein